jgi:predicted HicB family RNase H-like nuclease
MRMQSQQNGKIANFNLRLKPATKAMLAELAEHSGLSMAAWFESQVIKAHRAMLAEKRKLESK